MKSRLWLFSVGIALVGTLSACGQQPATEEAVITEPAAPPVPGDFDPCLVMPFADVANVIGTAPTITLSDNTGSEASGFATCAYGRADGSVGPTFIVHVARTSSVLEAMQKHNLTVYEGAQAIATDPDAATIWVHDGMSSIQFARGWWVVRYTVSSAEPAVSARLVAAPRFPT